MVVGAGLVTGEEGGQRLRWFHKVDDADDDEHHPGENSQYDERTLAQRESPSLG
jgi:hypothetical protein